MPFENTNTDYSLPVTSPYQIGRANVDPGTPIVEQSVQIPWASDPTASWVYFECAVGALLDSGIVVHNRLPQINNLPDTLASMMLDDPNLNTYIGPGVNITCRDQYKDIVQRMGHARYWFRIWGQALRVGYQVPIPGIKIIGDVPAIPYDKNPQWASNSIVPGANFGGAVLWRAQWSLWYTTAVPPKSQTIPAADPTAMIVGASPVAVPVNGIQVPYSLPDDNAQPSAPPLKTLTNVHGT